MPGLEISESTLYLTPKEFEHVVNHGKFYIISKCWDCYPSCHDIHVNPVTVKTTEGD